MICTICYSDFKKKTQLMRCKHFFCLDCIQTWHSCKNNLGQRPSCPICRTKFYDSDFIFTGEKKVSYLQILSFLNSDLIFYIKKG